MSGSSATPMILSVDEIGPYDRNPRRQPNPRYEEIYRSIKANPGLADDPVTITRRPDEDTYILKAGGNTRLQIHKTLWAETRNPIYRDVHCLFVPWESESEVLRAHIIENEARGELSFIDLARALVDLKRQLEDETHETLSRNEYIRRLRQMGYVVSKRQLIRYEFAVEVLEPLIPEAFASGLGGWNVDKIQEIYRAYRAYYQQHNDLEGLPQFDRLFGEVLAKHDGVDLDLHEVRSELNTRFSEYTGVSASLIKLQTQALVYETRQKPDPDPLRELLSQKPNSPAVASETYEKTAFPERDASHFPQFPSSDFDGNTTVFEYEDVIEASETRPESRKDLLAQLSATRSRCRAAARRFAEAFGLDPLIVEGQEGFGFYVDLPADPLPNNPLIRSAWWCLLGLSELTVSPYRIELAPPNLALQPLLRDGSMSEIYALVGAPPAVSELAFWFLSSDRLPDEAYAALIDLIGCCRKARRRFLETDLWNAPTVDQATASMSWN